MPEAPRKLEVWIRFGQPLDPVLDDYPRIFDAWEVIGVRGIVVGRMLVRDDAGRNQAIFEPDPAIYRRLAVEPPPRPTQNFREKRRKLDRLFAEAKRRGWKIFIFRPDAGYGPSDQDKFARFANANRWAARALDTLAQFPEVDGGIIDWHEWGFEIAAGHRSNIFNDLPEIVRPLAESMHYDWNELNAASSRLEKRLHNLNDKIVDTYAGRGFFGSYQMLGFDSGLANWLRFRTEVITSTVKMLKGLMSEQHGDLQLGIGPRSAVFTPLCGYDLPALARYADHLHPKHYFWHRGIDGLYGTVHRWLTTLRAWNPGLSERAAFQVIEMLLGVRLPEVKTALDFERGFPDAFFDEVVEHATRAVLAAVERPEQVVPWVDVGRRPHGGDPMGSGDFIRILEASRRAGLRRFLYHGYAHLTAAEVEVMRALCGDENRELPEGFELPRGR